MLLARAGLDIVAVGIEDECTVVRACTRARAGLTVVFASRSQRNPMKLIDGMLARRDKCNVSLIQSGA